MKLTRSSAEAIIQVLKDVLINNRYADKSMERVFKDAAKIQADERAFVAETSYDIIRYARMLEAVSGSRSLWKLLGAWAVLQGHELNDWKEFASISKEAILKNHAAISSDRKIRESIPDWLDELGSRELGDVWDSELKVLNTASKMVLRANTLKVSRDELKRKLEEEGIPTEINGDFPDALIVAETKNIFQSVAFQEGLFEMQDAGSQCIAPFLQVGPGMRVMDACAGTGGKSLHLAALMENKGRLISMDVAARKLEELKNRMRRAGVHNFEIRVIDSPKVIKKFNTSVDRLLLDVPCSGLGVLKRNPDAKWKLKPEYISKIIETQQQILSNYSSMVRVGGLLVYATCSILPSENENQVKQFLETNTNFILDEEKTIRPSAGFDGFYMARLKRLS